MATIPALTRIDRAERHKRIAAAYEGGLDSRTVAALFGMNDSHVRSIVRLYGVSRPVGRPANSNSTRATGG
jgi:hypothetical protein